MEKGTSKKRAKGHPKSLHRRITIDTTDNGISISKKQMALRGPQRRNKDFITMHFLFNIISDY